MNFTMTALPLSAARQHSTNLQLGTLAVVLLHIQILLLSAQFIHALTETKIRLTVQITQFLSGFHAQMPDTYKSHYYFLSAHLF